MSGPEILIGIGLAGWLIVWGGVLISLIQANRSSTTKYTKHTK